MEFNIDKFLLERTQHEHKTIVSRTNLEGIITYANETFCEISGYTMDELIGQSHSIIRHPDMPSVAFKDLWETIQNKKEWKGIIKNLRKDGGFYWVETTIYCIYKNGILVGYESLRSPIGYTVKLEQEKLHDAARAQEEEKVQKYIYI